MNKILAFCILLILVVTLGIFNIAPARGSNAHAVAITAIALVIDGSGSAGTGTLSLTTVYLVQLNPTSTLVQGAGTFNGTLTVAGRVASIFTLNAATFSATGCAFLGVIVLGSLLGQPVTETIFGNCLPSQAESVTILFQVGNAANPAFSGHGSGTLSPKLFQACCDSASGCCAA